MGTKLSILNDSNSSPNDNGWFDRSRKISANEIINKIENPNAEKETNILTAVPSPIARYHIFDIAFYYLGEFLRKKNQIDTSNTFFKLVSEALDAIEIVFYFNNLKAAYPDLTISTFSVDDKIKSLKASQEDGHQKFGSVLEKYFKSEPFNSIKGQSFIIKFGTELVAITSPLTLWMVPEDKNFVINSVSGPNRSFFNSNFPVHLRDRDAEFIYYLFTLKHHFQQTKQQIKSLNGLWNYLDEEEKYIKDIILVQKIKAINVQSWNQFIDLQTDNVVNVEIFGEKIKVKAKSEIVMATTIASSQVDYKNDIEFHHPPVVLKDGINPITGRPDNSTYSFSDPRPFRERTIPQRGIKYPTICLNDFFERNLIMLEYPICKDFIKPEGFPAESEFSFLLPIKPLYFKFFSLEDLKRNLKFSGDKDNCKFEIKIPVENGGTVTLQRRYSSSSKGNDDSGGIVKLSFGLALFPFIRYLNQNYNDYYSVLLIDGEYNDPVSKSSEIKLEFYNEGGRKFDSIEGNKIETAIRLKKDTDRGVISHELNNEFDFIRVNFDGYVKNLSGMIVPQWLKKGTSNDPGFNIAVDFGTTNTTLALKMNGQPQTVEYSESEKIIVALNSQKADTRDVRDLTEKFGKLRAINFLHSLYSYFIPLEMSESGFISFPIRSAILESSEVSQKKLGIFKFRNIAFGYNKVGELKSEITYTDLKWAKASNLVNNLRLKDFMREILMMARTKVISAGGDPSKSRLMTFRPSSLSSNMAGFTNAEWQTAFKQIFKNNSIPDQITESEAPAFYLWKHNRNKNGQTGRMFGSHSTLIIDIGGGSTDIAVFTGNQLQYQTSLKFAGNDLWYGQISRYFFEEFNSLHPQLSNLVGKQTYGVIQAFFSDFQNKLLANEEDGHELFNFIFSIDDDLEKSGQEKHFSNLLKDNDALKIVILYFYSAIIFHVLELLKLKKFAVSNIRFINLTGRGSNMLRILGSLNSSRPTAVEEFTKKLFYEMTGNLQNDLEIHLIENSKEITAWGGLEWLDSQTSGENINKIDPIYYLGTGSEEHIYDYRKTTEIKSFIDHKESIIDNINIFHSKFFSVIETGINIENEFGIEQEKDAVKWFKSLKGKEISDQFDILYASLDGKYGDTVNHSIFFEPIKMLIEDVFTELKNKQ